MEYVNRLKEYGLEVAAAHVDECVAHARAEATKNQTTEVYRRCFGCVDLTSLNVSDSASSIRDFVRKAVAFGSRFKGIPNVASVCVYPSFVDVAGVEIGDSGLRITSVAGGFPAAQTYLEVKMLEVAMAAENGADEIDVVMNVGAVLEGDYETAANEIEILYGEVRDDVTMKVIIESGALETFENVRKASLLAMLTGVSFIKTSTGKHPVAATPEAVVVMCEAIRDLYRKTGRKVGLKVAGGIKSPQDVALYYTIVDQILGQEWLCPELFRIGASSVANNLLSAITGKEEAYY